MESETLGTAILYQIPLDNVEDLDVLSVGRGRASFSSFDEKTQKSYYLYHTISPTTSTGSWVFNDEFGVPGSAIAYRYSWAVAPHLIENVNEDEHYWLAPSGNGWGKDYSMKFTCIDEEPSNSNSVVYFESSPAQPTLTGFYIARTVTIRHSDHSNFVYTHIPQHDSIEITYLFKYLDMWMVGEDYTTDTAIVYVINDVNYPTLINSTQWNYLSRDLEDEWTVDTGYIYNHIIRIESVIKTFPSVYDSVRYAHSMKHIPIGHKFLLMRNNVPIPVIGLGTGGIWHENAHAIFEKALREGYRFFDLAREYGNEHVLPEVFDRSNGSLSVNRNDLFIQSKVWPTDLGYHPTMDALLISLDLLKTNYIDAYLLHWPSCNAAISWMHCETTIDPEGTWQSSWRALEKAYSEGLINSIGVSNFDSKLLHEILDFAIVKPHIIQNFADPGSMDQEVRQICQKQRIIYQPYASGRNIRYLPEHIQSTLNRLSEKYNQSPYAIILRFFIQTGQVAAIPRTNNIDHLSSNLKAFTWSLDEDDMKLLGWGPEINHEL